VDEDCGQSEILAKMCQPWNESALQVNNSWGCISRIVWGLPSALLRTTIHYLVENKKQQLSLMDSEFDLIF
jgi:hypothetical protein